MTDDTIYRQAAIEVPERFIKDCNPEHFVGHQKFIEYMDDAEIGSFGNWQFANGFNMGLTAAEVAIEKLPSAQPEYWFDEWCTDCKEYDHERHCCPRFNHVIRTTLQDVQAELDEKDWTFDDDTKQITFVVPIDVYNATQTIFISPGYEGETGLRGKVFLTQPEKCEDCENFNKTRLLIPQPERKKGHWIEINESAGVYECDQCHERVCCVGKYCMNCGSLMEVAK